MIFSTGLLCFLRNMTSEVPEFLSKNRWATHSLIQNVADSKYNVDQIKITFSTLHGAIIFHTNVSYSFENW